MSLLDRAFAARWPGRCMACQEGFEPGEMIVMMDAQTVHAAGNCIALAEASLLDDMDYPLTEDDAREEG